MSSTPDPDALDALRAENARLIGLLEAHGIPWRRSPAAAAEQVPSRMSTDEKVRLFGQLFRGRTDVYRPAPSAEDESTPQLQID